MRSSAHHVCLFAALGGLLLSLGHPAVAQAAPEKDATAKTGPAAPAPGDAAAAEAVTKTVADAPAAPKPVTPPYLVADARTGEVLQHFDAVRPWFPASTTKLMTAYVAFQAVKAGRIALDTPIVVSTKARSQPPSKMGFPVGTELTLGDALKIMMVKSANDIAMAVAEGVGGSEEGFARLMNAEATRLTMWRSHFVNPHGLPEPRQYTTARDMAVLARALLTDFPEHRDYFRIPAVKYGGKVMRNYNTLIERYPGAIGMKTGFICSSGYNLIAAAERDGREVIAVVFGSMNGKARGEQAARLLNAGLEADKERHRTNLANVSSGSTYEAPFDMRPVVCPDRRQATAAADNPESDEATAKAEKAEPAAPVLGPRIFVGPPVEVHANVPPKGSTVAARPGPLPRDRPEPPAWLIAEAAKAPPPDLAHAFVSEEGSAPADDPTSAVIGTPPAPLPKPRPAR